MLLGTTGEGAPLELVVILDAFEAGDVQTAEEAAPVPDAPLSLHAALPAPG